MGPAGAGAPPQVGAVVSVISWFLWEVGPVALLLDKPLGRGLQEPVLQVSLPGPAPGFLCPWAQIGAGQGRHPRAKFKGVSQISE